VIRRTGTGLKAGRGQGCGGGSFTLRFGSTRYWVGSTRSISSEVRLEGMVDKNLLLESTNNIRVFLSSIFRTDHSRWTPVRGVSRSHRSWNIAIKILMCGWWRSIRKPLKRVSASILAELPRLSSSQTIDVRSSDFSTYLILFMKTSFIYKPILAPPICNFAPATSR
jgi:hypothetical protein